jgi:hypothetical protein
MRLAAILIGVALLAAGGLGAARLLQRDGSTGPCAATVQPGGDIGKALFDAIGGSTVCLAAGIHQPFRVSRARPDIVLRGEGPGRTIIQAGRQDAATVTDMERLTVADLTLRGGAPAGFYAARVRGLTLQNVTVEGAATAIHVEEGTDARLQDVTISRSSDFGLLVRRSASLSGQNVRVLESRGIGIGAVDSPGSVDLRQSEVAHAAGSKGEGLVLNGFARFALTGLTVRGGDPAGIYVAKAREARLNAVDVDGAHFGVHLDENTNAIAEDLTIANSTGVGLLIQRGGSIDGRSVRVLDAHGTGVSAINGAGQVTLRDSEISRVAAAGLFAGVAGCEDLPPASLFVPDCFLRDPPSQISTIRLSLERLTMADTAGPCLVFFAGVHAAVQDSSFTRCQLTGLFAWGATADVSGSTFDDNAEHALEYRAFPDPRGEILAPAAGTIEDTAIRGTRPLEGAVLGAAGPGPVLGGGVLAQGARLNLRRVEVSGNRDIGVSFVNRSSGELVESRILDNGGYGVCLLPDAAVDIRDTTVQGNRSDALTVCGGQPLTPR